MTEMKITCFTDIKGSTALTEELGHERMMPILDEHLRIGKALIEVNAGDSGEYVKNIGDAHMATFNLLEDAIRFATQFQQYVQKQPCLDRHDLEVRVALYLGAVVAKNGDVFGTGVNEAARAAGLTAPGTVTINSVFYVNMVKAWGKEKADRYFVSIGKQSLKGIKEKQELYVFKWDEYAKDHSHEGLASRIYRCLEDANTVLSNLNENDLNSPGLIIWPVVPRDIATAIHRGQIEIIRLLTLIGWKVQFIIADCGVNVEGADKTDRFSKIISSHAEFRNLCNIEISKLSYYFDKSYADQSDVLEHFRRLTTSLTLKNLLDINRKEYSEEDYIQIKEDAALNFLRPVLTCAAVLHLTGKYLRINAKRKIIVVAGEDEKTQWRHVIDFHPDKLGAIHNSPLIKSDASGRHTARQSKNWPIWLSKKDLFEEMKSSNAAKWVFQLFAQIPAFPSNEVSIDGNRFNAKKWPDEFKMPEGMDANKLIEYVWPILDTAR